MPFLKKIYLELNMKFDVVEVGSESSMGTLADINLFGKICGGEFSPAKL